MSDALTGLAKIQVPNQAELTASAKAALTMVTGYAVTTDTEYELAGEELVAIKAKAKRLEEQRTAITVPMNAALKAVNALFKEPAELLSQAETIIKRAMISYSDEVAAKAAAARREADRLAEQARAAAAVAEPERAAEIEIEAAALAPVAPPPPKATGISKVQTKIKARVVDKAAFLRYALDKPELLSLVEIDETKLSAIVRAMGGAISYPGVENYEERNISARAF